MDRLACVEVPALPLQLLLQRHPEWAGFPAAVVEEDKPQGRVLWVNRLAREAGVRIGHRYGPALSLAPGLRAGTLSDAAVREGVTAILDRLYGFSPDVEPSSREPGVFWIDAGGLDAVFPSLEAWAQAMRQDLSAAGYVAAVVVGFRRFGTYAAAKVLRGRKAHVFATPEREDEVCRAVPLTLVGLPPGVRDALQALGITRVGELLKLPAHGIRKRFGPEAHELHRFASGDWELPLNPTPPVPVVSAHVNLDYGEANTERLVFIVKPLVDRLLFTLGQAGQALVELQLRLALEEAAERLERIRTAEPTLSSVTVMELVKLRLVAVPPQSPVVGVFVTASTVTATAEQLAMFDSAPRRDPLAAARAFARLRAAFGEDVVVKAAMRDRHSPEGCFAWEPLAKLSPPVPRPGAPGMLVRRVLGQAEPLSERTMGDWWLLGATQGPVARWSGPYRLAGGWWRKDVQRDYYFAEMQRGELWWVYFDRDRARWYLQGEIS